MAEGTGAHGGATPEEALVPIIIISDQKESKHWTAKPITTTLNAANPVFEIAIVGLRPNEMPNLFYNGKIYKMKKNGSNYCSERLELNPETKQVTLNVGLQKEVFNVELQLAVKDDDIFDF